MKQVPATPEAFVYTWMQAHRYGYNQQWIAVHLGISRQAVADRASKYRKLGIQLPKLKNLTITKGSIDVDELNKMVIVY